MYYIKKVWTIIKAVLLFLQTNRDTIEQHIRYIKAELALLKKEDNAFAAGDGPGEGGSK